MSCRGAVLDHATLQKNFFKIVVDFMKYGCYYTEVASREAQQKASGTKVPRAERTLKIEDQTVQTTLKFL